MASAINSFSLRRILNLKRGNPLINTFASKTMTLVFLPLFSFGPPPLNLSIPILGDWRIKYGNQTTQTQRDCN